VSQDREVTTPLSTSTFESELNDAVGLCSLTPQQRFCEKGFDLFSATPGLERLQRRFSLEALAARTGVSRSMRGIMLRRTESYACQMTQHWCLVSRRLRTDLQTGVQPCDV
jgi:hypothetical protein